MLLRTQVLLAGFCLTAIWITTHRYLGIHHDGLFYAVQTLGNANPPHFTNDLFFAFGSQSDYTFFVPIHAWLSQRIGLHNAALSMVLLAQTIWAIALLLIAKNWLHRGYLLFGAALVFALPRQYGAYEIFQYAESFLTARIWAEALVLVSVAFALNEKTLAATIAAICASLIHPIIALPGILFLLAYRFEKHWRHVPQLILLAAATAFLLPRMDAYWIEMVQRRAPFVMLEQWHWQELAEPFTWIGILVAAAQAVPSARKVFLALALVGTVGIILAEIGSISKAALFIQAQPWRCLWLLKVGGLLALTTMAMERWRNSNIDRLLVAGFCAAALTANTLGGVSSLLLALLGSAYWRSHASPVLPRWLNPAAGFAIAMVLLETGLAILQHALTLFDRIVAAIATPQRLPLGDLAAAFDSPLAIILPFLAIALVRLADRRPKLALVSVSFWLLLSSLGWYRADDPQQHLLFDNKQARPFDELIPANATVYWDGNFLYTWFLLRQSNYASIQQSVGVVFSEQTARETRRRLARLSAFGSADSDVAANETLIPAKQRQPRRIPQLNDLVRLCEDPILDFVILPEAIGSHALPQWKDPLSGRSWYLHRCTDFSTAATA